MRTSINLQFYIGCWLLLILALSVSCKKEKSPVTEPPAVPTDTTYVSETVQTPQLKNVLIEEFTGVYCYTCPFAHEIVADIIATNPGRIAATNVHSHHYGIYDNPDVMGNLYDFRTEDGDSLVVLLGGVTSVPSGAVDRKIFSGETAIISQNRDLWEGYVNEQLMETVPVNIEMEAAFDSETRNLQVVVELNYLEDISETNFMSLILTENNIIDKQDTDTGIVEDYVHQHILRKILTAPEGNPITTILEPGRVYIRLFNYILPTDWNENNMDVIAIVHERDVRWDVLQTNFAMVNS